MFRLPSTVGHSMTKSRQLPRGGLPGWYVLFSHVGYAELLLVGNTLTESTAVALRSWKMLQRVI